MVQDLQEGEIMAMRGREQDNESMKGKINETVTRCMYHNYSTYSYIRLITFGERVGQPLRRQQHAQQPDGVFGN